MTPASLIWTLHGSPRLDCEPATGRCWVCAGPCERGQRVEDWSGTNFTGQNRVRCPMAAHVCEACVFVCSRTSPVLGRPAKEGKKLGGNFRNYSHLYERGWASPAFGDGGPAGLGYVNASKGEKPAIRAFLAHEHAGTWFAAIADSGQKHVVPWAPLNAPGRAGRVLFDEQIVRVPDDQSLVSEMMVLLTAGATKEEIERGEYGARAWQLCGALLAAFERAHARERHGGWFALALWLAQRDEESVQRRIAAEKDERDARRKRERKAPNTDGRARAGGARGVPGEPARKRAQALGPDPGPTTGSGADDGHPRGVGNEALSEPGPASAEQLGLFGAR